MMVPQLTPKSEAYPLLYKASESRVAHAILTRSKKPAQ